MSKVHLVTSCSKSKNGAVLDTVFPSSLASLKEAYDEWTELLKKRFSDQNSVTETKKLYRGEHWKTALKIHDKLPGLSLWVVSAGIGLRHLSDPAVPYEATFSNTAYDSKSIWEKLINSPPFPGKASSLKELLSRNSDDIFVIALSPVYLRAIENDLAAGAYYLPCPDSQLIIVTSKAYSGPLSKYARYGDKSMLKELNANMTTLNIKHADKIASSLPPILR